MRVRSGGRFAAVVGVLAVLGAFAAVPVGADEPPVPGVSDTEVRIGILYDATGPLAPSWVHFVDAFEARINLENKHPINGRKIVIDVADAGSGGLNAAQKLVETDGDFAVVHSSILGTSAFPYLHEHGVPVVGPPLGSPSWFEEPYDNEFSVVGNFNIPKSNQAYSTFPKFMKGQGAKKVGSIGYEVTATTLKDFSAAAKKIGLDPVYENGNIPLSGFDANSAVLGIKDSGAEFVNVQMAPADAQKLVTAARQAGLDTKFLTPNFGQTSLDDPVAAASAEGSYAFTHQEPPDLKTAATKKQAKALKKVGITGAPDLDTTFGWFSANMVIAGLKAAGPAPTRPLFIEKLRALKGLDNEGLGAQTFDNGPFPPAQVEEFCLYFAQVKDGKWVTVPKSKKPLCGTL